MVHPALSKKDRSPVRAARSHPKRAARRDERRCLFKHWPAVQAGRPFLGNLSSAGLQIDDSFAFWTLSIAALSAQNKPLASTSCQKRPLVEARGLFWANCAASRCVQNARLSYIRNPAELKLPRDEPLASTSGILCATPGRSSRREARFGAICV